MNNIHTTPIVAVRKDKKVAMAGNVQNAMGDFPEARDNALHKIFNEEVIVGFPILETAGRSLEEELAAKLEECSGNINAALAKLSRYWYSQSILNNVEFILLIADKNTTLIANADGDVIETEGNVAAIGRGGNYALVAATAYLDSSDMDAGSIAKKSVLVASGICVFSNANIIVEAIDRDEDC